MSKLAKALTAAAGNAGGDNLYVEDVFSTYLYDGVGGTPTINNGIDLLGEGGLAWFKNRGTGNHFLYDTARGAGNSLVTATPAAQGANTGLTAFGSTGFTLGNTSLTNGVGDYYASWTFRKAEKFFDVVTYTGTGSAQNIAHNLGSTPAVIIVKRTDSAADWKLYHRTLGATQYITLSNPEGAFTSSAYWNSTSPTDSVFSVGTDSSVNASGGSYVAYIYAHNDGGFGEDGSENIISCGSYTGNGSVTGPIIDLSYEPQYVMIYNATDGSNFYVYDTMRGIVTGGNDPYLFWNLSSAESNTVDYIDLTSTGFQLKDDNAAINGSSKNYIYIAIRRPMKTPESGTEVFTVDTPDSTSPPKYRSSFPVDMAWFKSNINSGGGNDIANRLTGTKYLNTTSTAAEANQNGYKWDFQNGWYNDQGTETNNRSWMFKRATGFFDVVAWQVDGTGNTTINHNLGVVPEMVITKNRNSASATYNWWVVGHKDLPGWDSAEENDRHVLRLNTNAASQQQGYHRDFTASTIRLIGVASGGYTTTDGVVAYLFATLDGVSKVGSYTGTGADLNVDCGFSAGARFILIKRTNTTGDWFYWDYERGITAGNDPYLLLNSTVAQVTNTDYIDPLSSGFTVTAGASFDGLNNSGGSYIFLAIA